LVRQGNLWRGDGFFFLMLRLRKALRKVSRAGAKRRRGRGGCMGRVTAEQPDLEGGKKIEERSCAGSHGRG